MGGKHPAPAIGKPKYQESSNNDSFSSFFKRHQEPTEDTPISLDLMHDRVRGSYHAFQIFCTTRFGWLMCFLLILTSSCSITSVVLYVLYDATIWNNPNILCVNSYRFWGMIFGMLATLMLIVGFTIWIGFVCRGRSRSRKSFANLLIWVLFAWFLCPILLTILFNILETPMLIKSPDNIIYHCDFDKGYMDAHLILFSPANHTPIEPDQSCEFWKKNTLCDADLRGHAISDWIVINGTIGAYHCQTQDSKGHDHCLGDFDGFSQFLYWGIAFSVLATVLLLVSLIVIGRRESLRPCTECFGSTPCCKQSTCCESLDEFLFHDLYHRLSCDPM